MSLSQAIRTSTFSILLFFLLNSCTFFNLSDMIDHIYDDFMGLMRINLYYNTVEQTTSIFEIGSFFMLNLIKVIKKDKNWQNKELASVNVAQILTLLARYDKVV